MLDEINLKEYAVILNRRKWIILVCLLLSILVGVAIYLLTTPIYSASAKITMGFSAAQRYTTSERLNNLIKSDDALNFVNRKLHLKYPTEELRKNIIVNLSSPEITVIAYSTKPEEAAEIANLLAKHFVDDANQDEIPTSIVKQINNLRKEIDFVNNSEKETRVTLNEAESEKVSTALENLYRLMYVNSLRQQLVSFHLSKTNLTNQIFTLEQSLKREEVIIESKAVASSEAVRPRLNFNLALSAIVGVIIGLSLAFGMESLEERKTSAV